MAIFTETHIKSACDYGSFQRGKSYFQSGRVQDFNIELEIEDRSIIILGFVAGSYQYSQNIEIIRKNKLVDIDGDCDCPVGYNCKHVVAVLLAFLEKYPHYDKPVPKPKPVSLQTKALNQWLEGLSSFTQPTPENHIDDPKQWLAYIIKQNIYSESVEIEIVRTGFKKDMGYYKPKTVNFYSLFDSVSYYGNPPKYFNSGDRTILSLINSQRSRYFSNKPIILEGTLGKIILEKMLNSRRCFWGEVSDETILFAGSPLELKYQWKSTSLLEDTSELITNLKKHQLIVPTEPLCYVDLEKMQIGELQGNLNKQHIETINQMPPVANDNLQELSFKLIAENLENSIPLPTPIEVTHIDSSQLTPKILLSKIVLDNNKELYAIHLSWLYADIDVQLFDDMIISKKSATGYVKITRDESTEIEYIEQLYRLDFELFRFNDNSSEILFLQSPTLTKQEQLFHWKKFFESDLHLLREQGWKVDISSDFHLDFIEPEDDWDMEVVDENDWFSLKFDLKLGKNKKIPLIPIISPLLNDYDLDDIPEELLVETKPGQYLTLEKNRVMPILKLLYELFDTPPLSQDSIKISAFDALQLNKLTNDDATNINWLGSKKLKTLGDKLAKFDGLKQVLPSKYFKGELREYQQQGLNWLQFLRDFEFGGLLADDMGLGKTVQTLVHLQKEKTSKRMKIPCLVVAPTSLMSNWKREAAQFTPNLKVLILQGSDRKQYFDKIEQHDLILTTYPLIVRDYDTLSEINFYTIVLDEAQNIKNPKAKATKLLKTLKTRYRLALTGTPMENHLGEMWSIFDFLMPGFLGSEAGFRRKYRTPIEKHGNQDLSKMLNHRVKPFLLRRNKEIVAKELPPKTTIIKSVTFESSQSTLYESIRIAMEKKIMNAISAKGLNRSHITILDALLKLRQVCCDPQLLKLTQAKKVKASAKLELLMLMLPELLEEGRKILVFSQFTSMLSIIEAQLNAKKIDYTKLTGSTKNREQAINRFTDGQVNVFLISLKAGGVGLNLTEADTVIHYDPWWNPAVENQASDRAHRIGQDKPVFVYKLVVENTLEEKILEMQQRKQALADGVYGDKKTSDGLALTSKDIEDLLSPSI